MTFLIKESMKKFMESSHNLGLVPGGFEEYSFYKKFYYFLKKIISNYNN